MEENIAKVEVAQAQLDRKLEEARKAKDALAALMEAEAPKFEPEPEPVPEPKRGPGRPKGSKNKATTGAAIVPDMGGDELPPFSGA